MNEASHSLVSTGTSLADQTWQGQCENSFYSRHEQNTKEGIQLRPLPSQNVTENSNLSAAGSSQEDQEKNDHVYTHIYLGVSPKKVYAIVAVASILVLATTIALIVSLNSKGLKEGERFFSF